MTECGEPHEVVPAHVNLLHERRLGVYESPELQDPMELGDATHRVEDVLEDGLDDHGIERAVGERQIVPVGNSVRAGSENDVRGQDS